MYGHSRSQDCGYLCAFKHEPGALHTCMIDGFQCSAGFTFSNSLTLNKIVIYRCEIQITVIWDLKFQHNTSVIERHSNLASQPIPCLKTKMTRKSADIMGSVRKYF